MMTTPSSRHQPAGSQAGPPAKKKDEFQRILEARAKQIEDQKCFVDGETKHQIIHESEFEKIHKRITATQQAKWIVSINPE